MAENLSIPQLQQAIQAGTIPAYVGLPLLQDKVKMAKSAQMAQAPQMGPQPSIKDQVMAEADQVEQGVQSLPTNLPESMAGGGIVAFAEGGMYDDEEDSYEDRIDAERDAEMNALMDEYAQTFQGGIGQLPAAEKAAPRDREGIAGNESASDFVARIMHKESRGQRYGKDGKLLTSEKGAQGEMQVMPGTSRDPGFGVKPARDDSPDELARVGRDYANTLLERYKDPRIAAIAYNWGPGNTDKWLMAGADVSKLPKETQGYVKGFSGVDGESEVKESSYGDQIKKAFGFFPDMLVEGAKKVTGYSSLNEPEKPVKEKVKAETKPAATPKAPSAPSGEPEYSEDFMRQFDQAGERYMNEREAAANAPAAPAEKPLSKLEQYQQALASSIEKRREGVAKQREQDKYMALLSAGLGMMGGTSRNAFANIGAGGQQGIQSLMASNKDRTAEENALLSGDLNLMKLGTSAEQAAEMRKLRADMQKDVLAQREAAARLASEDRGLSREQRQEKLYSEQLGQLRKYYGDQALAQYKGAIGTEEQKAKILAEAEAEMMKRPEVRALYEKVYKMPAPGGAMGAGPIPENAVRRIKG
jgi:hypothetical protein